MKANEGCYLQRRICVSPVVLVIPGRIKDEYVHCEASVIEFIINKKSSINLKVGDFNYLPPKVFYHDSATVISASGKYNR